MSTPKTWFITGASSGFGSAFANYALEMGYNVVATAGNPDRLKDLVARAPDRVLALQLDVNRPQAAQAAVAAAARHFGRIDVIINNAGYAVVGAAEETPESELRALMETNFFGAVAVINAALPVLRAQQGASIVAVGTRRERHEARRSHGQRAAAHSEVAIAGRAVQRLR